MASMFFMFYIYCEVKDDELVSEKNSNEFMEDCAKDFLQQIKNNVWITVQNEDINVKLGIQSSPSREDEVFITCNIEDIKLDIQDENIQYNISKALYNELEKELFSPFKKYLYKHFGTYNTNVGYGILDREMAKININGKTSVILDSNLYVN